MKAILLSLALALGIAFVLGFCDHASTERVDPDTSSPMGGNQE